MRNSIDQAIRTLSVEAGVVSLLVYVVFSVL